LFGQLDEREVGEGELAATLAAQDEVVPSEDIEPGSKALKREELASAAQKEGYLPGFSDPAEARSASFSVP
jgi:hypothetical protein